MLRAVVLKYPVDLLHLGAEVEVNHEDGHLQNALDHRAHPQVIAVSIFLSIVIFTPLEIENTFLRMALHLLMLPVIVGVTYEFNRYVGGHDGGVGSGRRTPTPR